MLCIYVLNQPFPSVLCAELAFGQWLQVIQNQSAKTGGYFSTHREDFAVAFIARKQSEDSRFLWTLRLLNLSNYRDKCDIACSQSSTTGWDGNKSFREAKEWWSSHHNEKILKRSYILVFVILTLLVKKYTNSSNSMFSTSQLQYSPEVLNSKYKNFFTTYISHFTTEELTTGNKRQLKNTK